ncbi:MAG: hypothetical protein C4327_05075, partial [Meiothermus sp.]
MQGDHLKRAAGFQVTGAMNPAAQSLLSSILALSVFPSGSIRKVAPMGLTPTPYLQASLKALLLSVFPSGSISVVNV